MKRIILVSMFFLIFTSFMYINAQWAKTYGGSKEEYANSIQQTSDGGYIVAGYTKSFGAGETDIWVLKLSSNGAIEWHHTSGGINTDKSYSIQQTSDGGYIVAGRTASFGAGHYDIWVLKLSSNGAIEWQRTYGGRSSDVAYSIQQTSDGGYIVAGYTDSFYAGGEAIWVLKLSSDGDIEWQRTYGDGSFDIAYSIQQTSDGGYIVAGRTTSFGAGSYDIWVLKLSSNGDIDSFCGFIESSDATFADTVVSPADTSITPRNTSVSPLDTFKTGSLLSETLKHTLTISAATGGTTDPAPDTYRYNSGIEIQIEAIPETDYRFYNWTGDRLMDHWNDNPIAITMDGDRSIKANFSAIPPVKKKGGCFIATAAYGSQLHPHVRILQDFRDIYLMSSKFGCSVVDLYYKYSPFVADLIAKHKALKIAVRISLILLVAFSFSMLHFGTVITTVMLLFIFSLSIFPILFCRRKIIKRSKKVL